MKLAFILDPLEELKPHKDTSLAIMREAARRGHQLFVLQQHDILLRQNQIAFKARPFSFREGPEWYDLGASGEYPPQDFDAALMRKDPPFDMEYVTSTWLLELAEQQGAHILNRPQAIRDFNEKLSVARFPQFAPPFLVTRQMAGESEITTTSCSLPTLSRIS